MAFMSYIITVLNNLSNYFYWVYWEASTWPYPLWYVASYFYQISIFFNNLAWYFYDFSIWVNDVVYRLNTFLTDWQILSYLNYWLDRAIWAWDWVVYAWWNVTNIISDWWSSTQYTVLAWVDEAKSYAATLVAGVDTWLGNLQSAWDDFKGRIPSIDEVILWWGNWATYVTGIITTWWSSTLLEVQGLINSAFTERESFWSGWQDWRDKVTEFFTDPEEWLYKAADRIIERFW